MKSESSGPSNESHKDGDLWRTPLDHDEFHRSEGMVHLIKDRCKGCEFCIEFCPRGILELSEEFNVKGYHPPRITNPNGCYACRLCELICPEFAIFIEEKINQPV